MDANTTVRRRRNCSPYPPEDLARFEALLKEQQSGLLQCCQGLTHVVLRKCGDEAGDDSTTSDDTADMASDLCQQDLSLNFLSRAESELQEITQALDRIERRSYGLCDHCDQPIPMARLEAIPTASSCVTCKAKSEPPV
ncbi:MAG TPA: TraR/DksA C4-type zinc finger protein [Planctomycetota bacterium]|nr:TraR/DksA C4-type zinc finger protein [Planctomycetota bacterium]